MAWLRSGDTAATDPRLLKVYEHPEVQPWSKCELWGFVHFCATQAAQHNTDYVVSLGAAMVAGGDRAHLLLEMAEFCGLMEQFEEGDRTLWRIVEDSDLLHMRSAEEIERDAQRKRDNANHGLIIPVRVRDGDQCRYCRKTVQFGDRKSGRGGTYDHREGVGKDTTVDTLVVACRECNRDRGDDTDADLRIPLLPAPREPFYTQGTEKFINTNSWAISQGISVTASSAKPSGTTGRQRPASQAGHAPTPTQQDPGIAHHGDSDPTPGIARDSDSAQPRGIASRSDSDRAPGIAHPSGDSDRASGIAHGSDRGETGDAAPHPAGNGARHARPAPRPRPPAPDLSDPDRSCRIPRASKSGSGGTGRVGSGSGQVGRPVPPGEGAGSADGDLGSGPGVRSRGRRRKRKR